jgi:hypothetical protein
VIDIEEAPLQEPLLTALKLSCLLIIDILYWAWDGGGLKSQEVSICIRFIP